MSWISLVSSTDNTPLWCHHHQQQQMAIKGALQLRRKKERESKCTSFFLLAAVNQGGGSGAMEFIKWNRVTMEKSTKHSRVAKVSAEQWLKAETRQESTEWMNEEHFIHSLDSPSQTQKLNSIHLQIHSLVCIFLSRWGELRKQPR